MSVSVATKVPTFDCVIGIPIPAVPFYAVRDEALVSSTPASRVAVTFPNAISMVLYRAAFRSTTLALHRS